MYFIIYIKNENYRYVEYQNYKNNIIALLRKYF